MWPRKSLYGRFWSLQDLFQRTCKRGVEIGLRKIILIKSSISKFRRDASGARRGLQAAGFLDRSISTRLSTQHVSTYVEAFRTLFPEGAGYEHDQLDRRADLDADQRAVEPRNADSHLAFIASGLRPCVTHPNRPGEAVCFVDLDGVVEGRPRRRLTRVIGFRSERVIGKTRIEVPVSAHPIDSINLKDPRLGIYPAALGVRRRTPASARDGFASSSSRPSAIRR